MVYHIATKPSNKAFGYSHPSFRSKTAHIWCACNTLIVSAVKMIFVVKFLGCRARFTYPLDIIVGAMPAGFSMLAGHLVL